MLDPVRAIRHARRMVALSMITMAVAAGFLIWSGTALMAVNMQDAGLASLGLAAVAALTAGLMQPRHRYSFSSRA